MRRAHPADYVVAALALCALAFFLVHYLGASAQIRTSSLDAAAVRSGPGGVWEKLDAVLGLSAPDGAEERLDLNRASADELAALPGIGETLSARIVEYRRYNGDFAALEELEAVTGIGPQLVRTLSEYLYVADPGAEG